MHDVGLVAEPQGDQRFAHPRRDHVGRHASRATRRGCANCGGSALVQVPLRAIDQMPSAPIEGDALRIDRGLAAHRLHGDAVGMAGEGLDPRAEFEADVGMFARSVAISAACKIAAMHDPVGRAVTLFDIVEAECARFPCRSCRAARAPPMARPPSSRRRSPSAKADQNAGRVRGELDAGAGFFRPLGLIEHDGAKPALGECQCRGQSADPGSGNDDGARAATRQAR